MGEVLVDLVDAYRLQYGESSSSGERLRDLYNNYVRRRENTLMDSAVAALAVDEIFFSDAIDLGSVSPQMEEAFARAYPGQDLAQRLEELRELAPDSPEAIGFLSNWKGVLHEILVRDRLNDGQQVGSVVLSEGQRAVLPIEINKPGFDIRILNSDGTEDIVLQAKATNEIGLVTKALEKYPDIQIAATDEVAADVLDQRVFPSGFDNEILQNQVDQPMAEAWDGPIEEFVEHVLPALPFVIITTTEGAKVLLGKQSFEAGLRRAAQRSVKTVAAIGAGLSMTLMGVGVFSLPAAFFTRLGIDRYNLHALFAKRLEDDRNRLLSCRAVITGAMTDESA